MNRLATESSPYLRQHANNPVNWYAWGEDAFGAAKMRDAPILLSVGYSSCHWCHVMAHESFEDEAVAQLMNESFINVKVDREERPDVDAIYMEAVQAMTGQGGWPMTVFLTPTGEPFFAGTYFGKVSMPGRPNFVELIEAVNTAWYEQRDEVTEQAGALRGAIMARTHSEPSDHDVVANGQDWFRQALTTIEATYDKEWGGFGSAPKFPQTSSIELLMRSGRSDLMPMVVNTLDAMASGGIYDHVGGGFHRYSVDAFWMVPHFEKMLYDQAALARTYVDAYLLTGETRFRQVATETIDYVLRDLAAPAGGWYCAEDADTEGEEGRYYVWRPEDIDRAIGDIDISSPARTWYGVTGAGNFEGSNILHRPVRGDLVRSDVVEQARRRLFEARLLRVRPGLDDKVITEWTAMFLSTLAYAGAAFERADWVDEATRAADFLLDNLRQPDGRWLRAWHAEGGAKQPAFANDYAWLVDAFTKLGEATGHARWRALAAETADQMIDLFWDDQHGGLFTTGRDGEALIVRSKDLFDGATPSANATAAVALAHLSALTGRGDFRERALAIIALVADPVINHPTAFAYLLGAIDVLSSTESSEVVIAGDHADLVKAVQTTYRPRAVLAWGEPDDSPLWEGRTNGAYVCHNYVCALPTVDGAELRATIAPSIPREA